MEEENSNQEQEGEAEKGGKKGIIIIAIVVILAIGVSVGATLFLLGGDDSEDPEPSDVAEEDEIPAGPMQYHAIKPPILVTFNVGGRQRYMQVHLSVASRNADSILALRHHMPLIRSKIISTYGSQEFKVIQTEAGKLALIETTLALLNEVLESEGEPKVEHVYFTNFVLQ